MNFPPSSSFEQNASTSTISNNNIPPPPPPPSSPLPIEPKSSSNGRLIEWLRSGKLKEIHFEISIDLLLHDVRLDKRTLTFDSLNNTDSKYILEIQERNSCPYHALHFLLGRQFIPIQHQNVVTSLLSCFILDSSVLTKIEPFFNLISTSEWSELPAPQDALTLESKDLLSSLCRFIQNFNHDKHFCGTGLEPFYYFSMLSAFNDDESKIFYGCKRLKEKSSLKEVITAMLDKGFNGSIIFNASRGLGHFTGFFESTVVGTPTTKTYCYYDSISTKVRNRPSGVNFFGPLPIDDLIKTVGKTYKAYSSKKVVIIFLFKLPEQEDERKVAVDRSIRNWKSHITRICGTFLNCNVNLPDFFLQTKTDL